MSANKLSGFNRETAVGLKLSNDFATRITKTTTKTAEKNQADGDRQKRK